MTFRRFSWGPLIATALPVIAALVIVLWQVETRIRRDHPAFEEGVLARPAVQTLIVAGLAGVGAIAVLTILQTRRSSRLLLRIAQAARNLSVSDLSTSIEVGGARELELLVRAINQMRQRLAAQVETMDRQRRTFESLLTQLREGVVVVDAGGCVSLMNPSAARLLNLPDQRAGYVGLAVERCIPQLELQRLLAAGPGDSTRRSPAPEAVSHQPREPRSAWETRLSVETSTGSVHLLAQVGEIALPGAPAVETTPTIGRLLVLTDITDLTRNIQMKTDFVANASHELRTPLSTIRAAVETLQHLDFQQDADSAGRFIEVIERQSARLEALASDLLDLSRVESDAAQFKPRSVSIAELARQIQAQFAERLSDKGLELEINLAECARTSIQANPQLLRLVLDNLIDNAIKFSESGAQVRLLARSDNGSVTFEVADDGCGISPEDQTRVFERFYQVERARSGSATERGTGLGLSIVRHAVNAMSGEVSLRSELGAGTTVTVRLPQPTPP